MGGHCSQRSAGWEGPRQAGWTVEPLQREVDADVGREPLPGPGALHVRMRSPPPTCSGALLLRSKSCSTDRSKARAATRVKNAFTFSPAGTDSQDPRLQAGAGESVGQEAGRSPLWAGDRLPARPLALATPDNLGALVSM